MIPFSNNDIAQFLEDLAFLMETEGSHPPFKIRSYYKAANTIRETPGEIFSIQEQEWKTMEDIGSGISRILSELRQYGTCREMEEIIRRIPETLLELRTIRGLGPARIRTLWKEAGIKNLRELQKAIEQNKLVSVRGLGENVLHKLKKELDFLEKNKGKKLFKNVYPVTHEFMKILSGYDSSIQLNGDLYAMMPVVEKIDFFSEQSVNIPSEIIRQLENKTGLPVHITTENPFSPWQFMPGTPAFTESLKTFLSSEKISHSDKHNMMNFLRNIPPEWHDRRVEDIVKIHADSIVSYQDLCGLIHAHTTWSDGQNSIEEMAGACMERKWQWMTVTDHSRSAFYANGLNEKRLELQKKEIEQWNAHHPDFRIFHGIECDILRDGQLDFPDEILKTLEVVIVSVHSGLNMKEEEATRRLIKAIEHPYVHILGHPTGRLLLQREGYPVHHHKLIDACAAQGVAIELNANPYRLDLDYRWIEYCMERGVHVCISPDAHSVYGISDTEYGVIVARKGLMQKKFCLNTYSAANFLNWLRQKWD